MVKYFIKSTFSRSDGNALQSGNKTRFFREKRNLSSRASILRERLPHVPERFHETRSGPGPLTGIGGPDPNSGVAGKTGHGWR